MSSCKITGEPHCKCEFNMDPITEPTVKEVLRKIFTDHSNYTHLYIIAEVYNLPTKKYIVNRLMENQEDIGSMFTPIIGNKLAKELVDLLKEHISRASKTVIAANKLGENSKEIAECVESLFENSEKVSRLLGSLNPSTLSYTDVSIHFKEHNQYVIDLAMLYINGEINKIVRKYDCYYTHMLHFSDMLCLLT